MSFFKSSKLFLYLFFSTFLILPGLYADDQISCLPLGNPNTCFDLRLIQQGKIYFSKQDKIGTSADLIQLAVQSRVVLLGESHTNLEQHQQQSRLIEDLVQQGKKVIIGMEFFDRDQNSLLTAWKDGKFSESEFLAKSDWINQIGYHYHYYRPILEVVKKHHLPIVGLNIPRAIVHKVAQTGLESLTPNEQAMIGNVKLDNIQHRYLIQRIFGSFAIANPARFDRMYSAQCTWDVAMAGSIESTLALYDPEYVMVVIVGSGHVIYDLGIPSRLHIPNEQVLSVVFYEVNTPESAMSDPHFPQNKADYQNIIARNLADIVIATDNSEIPSLPHWGLKFAMQEQKVIVTQATTQGIVSQLNWRKGDVILQLQGKECNSLEELQTILFELRWQDHLTWQICRGDQILTGETILQLPIPSK